MDTIGEFLTRIRNAGMARHEKVDIPASNVRVNIAKVLKQYGYIRDYRVAKNEQQGIMRVYLGYGKNGKHLIEKIARVSTPGRRLYLKVSEIPSIRSGYGMAIVSTNKGVMSGVDAVKNNVGGEFLCKVW